MTAAEVQGWSRRGVLKAGAAGGLVVAFGSPLHAKDSAALAGWVSIDMNGAATIFTNTSEIGQGTGTAIAQLIADELDLPWQSVKLAMAPVDKAHINPGFGEYATYGSGGVAQQVDMFRTAGAAARQMLIEAAARAWHVPASECSTNYGAVVHAHSSRRANYGALADAAGRLPVPQKPPLKTRKNWRYIGKPVPRLDIPAKTNGAAIYGVDVKLPGLKVASIAQCPAFGGRLRSVDPKPALAIPGVERVVNLKDAVVVVASGYWPARKGLDALIPEWDLRGASKADSKEYDALLARAVMKEGVPYAPRGQSAAALVSAHRSAVASAKKKITAVYQVPFAAHATMEPMNATARPVPGGMELWLPTQVQSTTRDAVAKLLKMPPSKVIVHTTLAGGGFGRRGEIDFALQVAEIAHMINAPVKLIWSRQEDIQHDWYRPAAAVRIEAALGADGTPVAWHFETACESLFEWALYGANKQYGLPVDGTAVEGLPTSPYALAAPRYGWTRTDVGVPVTFWRSVGRSQNVFALESFIDELAAAAKRDPLDYRRHLIGDNARARKVLEIAARKSDWNGALPKGHARGFAIVPANGSIVAHVVELSVEKGSSVRLHKVTCAVDCGLAVNPNSVAAQMEGGIAYGLSHAIFNEITLGGGKVQQSNFHDFPLLTLAQMPDVDVTIVESDAKPGGTGEEAVSAVAPAVANALFRATGKRIRRLPLSNAGFVLA
jgi:isoquinoline 1-oxidoreductase beta subunit